MVLPSSRAFLRNSNGFLIHNFFNLEIRLTNFDHFIHLFIIDHTQTTTKADAIIHTIQSNLSDKLQTILILLFLFLLGSHFLDYHLHNFFHIPIQLFVSQIR